MLCNPTMVREKSYLLRASLSSGNDRKNLKEKDLLRNIIGADSKVESFLKKRFKTPIEPKPDCFCSGFISTVKVALPDETLVDNDYCQITGVGTSFLSELSFGDVILVSNSKEALQIDEIIDDTTLKVTSNSNFNSNNSRFFVIPKELVLCSVFLSAKHTLLFDFEEEAYNLESSPIFKEFEKDVLPILKDLEKGNLFFESLLETTKINTFNRFDLLTKLNGY